MDDSIIKRVWKELILLKRIKDYSMIFFENEFKETEKTRGLINNENKRRT